MKKREYKKPKLTAQKLSTFFFACAVGPKCTTRVNVNVKFCNPT